MKRSVRYSIILLLAGTGTVCNAQYTGGNATGYSSGIYVPNPCAFVANSNIYYGSSSDGTASNSFIPSPCSPLVSTNIYVGGNADGSGNNSFIPSPCPPIINTNIYVGGDADGQASNSFIASICPPLPSTSIYYGGIADGQASNSFIPTICPPSVSTNIYYGGIADGHAGNSFIASICPPLVSTNIYFGGIADGWSRRQIIQSLCPLPIELLFFKARCKESNRLLTWSTASEINNNYFSIERSPDARSWSILAKIAGAGNSSDKRDYSYLDVSNYPGSVYYRLKQTDYDGKQEYFELVYSNCEEELNARLNVSPNPSNGKITVLYNGNILDVLALEVYNTLGDKVYSSSVFQSSIDLSKKAPGIYFIYLRLNSAVLTEKLVIE